MIHQTRLLSPVVALRNEPESPSHASTNEPMVKRQSASDPVEKRTRLICRQCRTPITRHDLGMTINGSHRHVFFNPTGDIFELSCFASAKNILPTGPRTEEFTWFPGFAWQVVVCAGCMTQLGWRFIGPDKGFFGLITRLLIEDSSL
ncbi:hypothetical protein GO013_02180 [Pseudodesulfovibrio sp. JC047]|uniref:cereblon family protein n=1 Tax=Pseudodesulfovibrio sp. JC047 TaxID=2683199 RepID=UPI0013D028F4|nr:cereblon family protein [Pseudodesulfovibrio sp. JC047]NDV18226.1 hypothetical protein [Pseudodesulfovibrio sp. JC047]